MAPPNALSCALFLILAFSFAGLIQARWLGSPWARRFDWPLDAGLRFRDRRLFGANKTARGFIVMVPASALGFAFVAAVMTAPPWPLSPAQYLALGAAAGFGFMAGELPNSFIKRQFDIPPGHASSHPAGRIVSALVDRLDSIIGMALVLAWLVPVPTLTWLFVIVIGPVLHGLFSVLVFRWGGKARPA